jgi:predicted DNA binding protein
LRDAEVPIFGGSARAIDRTGLVVRRPLVYRDGCIHGHIVGDAETLQATLDQLPDSITVDIDAIQQYPSADVNPVQSLSERQREAVETALELGYYETPRTATQDAVAAELGCAANTASEHLRKAEAKLVRAGVDVFNSSL